MFTIQVLQALSSLFQDSNLTPLFLNPTWVSKMRGAFVDNYCSSPPPAPTWSGRADRKVPKVTIEALEEKM